MVYMNKGLKDKILNLRDQDKSYNEIQEILGCSKGTISYHCSKLDNHSYSTMKIEDPIILEAIRLYNLGHTANSVALFLSISRTTVLKHVVVRPHLTDEERRINNYQRVKKRRKENKRLLVDYKGGKCELCGYDRCLNALDFHHRDPKKKSFSLSTVGLNKAYSILRTEVDKCDLLCSNCHREVHAKQCEMV